MPRYLTPVVGSADASAYLEAACQLVARDGGQLVALVIGLVPSSLPIGADTPARWPGLEYEAARVRRFGRAHGVEVETVLALTDSAGAALVALAEELEATAICLAYEPGWRAALRRWHDSIWQTVLDQAPCPVVLERPLPRERKIPIEPSSGHVPLRIRHHGEAG